jgi:hypothetical protein
MDPSRRLLSDFTADRGETVDALTGLASEGWTAMYDALHVALDLFDEREPDRRAIVLLTDGGDNFSEATLDATVERLQAGNEVLHIVELITTDRPEPRERFGRDEPGVDEADLDALGSLAAAAGQGLVASPEDLDAVSAVYEQVAASLMNQYELTYTSEAHGPTTVTIRLDHDDAVVEDAIEVELPPVPSDEDEVVEDEEAEEPADEAVRQEPDVGAVGVDDEVEVPARDWLEEPWVVYAAYAAVIGGLGFLVFYIVGYLRWRG